MDLMKDQKSMKIFFDNHVNKLDNIYENLSQEINLSNLISKIYLKFFKLCTSISIALLRE